MLSDPNGRQSVDLKHINGHVKINQLQPRPSAVGNTGVVDQHVNGRPDGAHHRFHILVGADVNSMTGQTGVVHRFKPAFV